MLCMDTAKLFRVVESGLDCQKLTEHHPYVQEYQNIINSALEAHRDRYVSLSLK